MNTQRPNLLARFFKAAAVIEAQELRAVVLSILFFLFLFGSYSIIKPVRDAMGTVYGVDHLQELFTGTFLASLLFAPLYSWFAARIRLSTFLPWVYGFIALSILGFYALFTAFGDAHDRGVAAAFYIWVSTFNILIISVFWSFMADLFSRTQAKRLFGFVAAGGSIGGVVGPLLATSLVKSVGNNGLMLIAAGGFLLTAALVRLLAREKPRLMTAMGGEAQTTTLDHKLSGSPFDGFRLLFRSPYLLLLAAFLLLMTWISTVVYFQLGELIKNAFSSREARTQAYANIDLAVNSGAVLIQLFGTGRIIKRFGVGFGLLANPVIMVVAFLGLVAAPILAVLGSLQVVRRVAEYAVAKPTREMLFTVVDQESRYKAKNVIDTVVYRFGDLTSAWVSSAILPYGVSGLAIFGAIVSVVWFRIAWLLGKRYESVRGSDLVGH